MAVDANREEFVRTLTAALKEKGVELPTIPDSVGRRAYLEFLASMGYREDELLPVFDTTRATGEMHGATIVGLLQALRSDDPVLLRTVGWIALNLVTGRDNTNLIVFELAQRLTEELNVTLPGPPFYAGVFPTNSFNAQCRMAGTQPLVLIDTGCMEMCEAAAVALLTKAPDEVRLRQLAATVDDYVLHGRRAESLSLDARGIDWGSASVSVVVNACEDFVLTHELAHLALGHIAESTKRVQTTRSGPDVQVVAKTEFEEFQADVWACRALVDRAVQKATKETDVAIAVAGPIIVLCLGLLVEGSRGRLTADVADGHPSASDRLYMIQVLLEHMKVHRLTGIGQSFVDMTAEVVSEHYPDVEMPPLLSRRLNAKLIPIFESLHIDTTNAAFIRDFV